MEEKVVITEDIIRNADSYLSLVSKTVLARMGAKECITPVTEAYTSVGFKTTEAAVLKNSPDRYIEDIAQKELYLMGVFARYYLKQFSGDRVSMSVDSYDLWASSAVFNQLERMKSSKSLGSELKDKIFDMLYDFKQFHKMLGCEIVSLVQTMNDTAERLVETINSSMTPDTLESVSQELDSLKEQMQAAVEEQKNIISGTVEKPGAGVEEETTEE